MKSSSWTTKLFAAALAIASLGISGVSVSGAEGADQPKASTLFQYSIHPSKEIASAGERIWIRNVLTNTSGHIVSGCINPYLGYEFQQQDRTSLEHQRVALDLDCMEGGKFRLAQGERFTWREKVIIPDWSPGPLTMTARTSMSLWQPLGIRDTEPGSVDLFATATIKIVEHCTLDILVQDSLGPLPGATVLLFHADDEPMGFACDSNGHVGINDLPGSPDYFVGVYFPGYQIVTEATTCPRPSDDPLVLTLRLDSSYKFQESPSEHRQGENLLIVNTPTDNTYPKPSCVLVKVMKLDQKGLLLEREPGGHLPPTARDISRFEPIEPGMTLEDAYKIVGPPDYRTDSGKHYDVYLLDSCWEVWIASEDNTVLARDYHDPSGRIRPIAN